MSILFNQICPNEEMPPKYTYLKLYDPTAYQYDITLEYRRGLMKRQITLCKEAVIVSKVLYGCTAWTLTQSMKKKLDGNCTRML